MAISKGRKPSGKSLGSMSEKGAPKRAKKNDARPGQKWWELPDEQVPGALMSTIQHIHKNQVGVDQEGMMNNSLYGGRLPGSAFGVPQQQQGSRGVHPSMSGRLTYNLYSIVMDALVSKITKENLSTQFVTQGGDYRQQRRAKKLSQFDDGMNYETGMDDLGPDAFRDGLLTSCGIIHTYPDWATKRVRCDRIMRNELFVDFADGFYGQPTQIHRVRMYDREKLLATPWAQDDPKVAEAIKNNHDTGPLGWGGEYQGLSDLIAVGESWRLPSGVEDDGQTPTDDGRHLVYISNAILTPHDERVWRKKRFPFSVYRWKKDTAGWDGIPLGRDLMGSQVEMNHLNIMFQRAFRMMAAFRIWVENGTVPDQHFQDKIGTVLHGPRGSTPPQFLTPPAMNEQYFKHRSEIKANAFEIARISQLSAVGQKPAGLDSGEAQRVYHDIESEGFSYAQKQYEAFRLDVSRMRIDVVRDIFEMDKKAGYKLRAPMQSSTLPGHRFLRSIDWKDVQLEEDEYILRGYSTSALPNTPAGRLATVQDLMRGGLIDADLGRKLLNFPDLAQVQSLLGAMEDWVTMCLDNLVEGGKAQTPDPLMPIPMARKLAMQEFALGAANGMEEKKLDLLRNWLAGCDRLDAKAQKAQLQQQMQAAQAAQAAQGGGAPMGVGAPPQTSPLLPPKGMQGAV